VGLRVRGSAYFEGFRTLATNGIDNADSETLFRMAGMMRGDRVKVESSGSAGLDAILQSGVHASADIRPAWPRAPIAKWRRSSGIISTTICRPRRRRFTWPGGHSEDGRRGCSMEHYRIDDEHSKRVQAAWEAYGIAAAALARNNMRNWKAAGGLPVIGIAAMAGGEGREGGDPASRSPRHPVSLVRLSW